VLGFQDEVEPAEKEKLAMWLCTALSEETCGLREAPVVRESHGKKGKKPLQREKARDSDLAA